MRSIDGEGLRDDVEALRAAISRFQDHSYEALTTPERLGLLDTLEREARRMQALGHQLINQIGQQADPAELGGKLSWAL
ncbi:hypothetical protein DQP57_18500, partial [Mycobacterium colombiense]